MLTMLRVAAEAERRVSQGGHGVPCVACRRAADIDGVDEVNEHEVRWETVDLTEQV